MIKRFATTANSTADTPIRDWALRLRWRCRRTSGFVVRDRREAFDGDFMAFARVILDGSLVGQVPVLFPQRDVPLDNHVAKDS